jgi:2',3'-cyclic-nucleotide 2'-phosphodiesterase/3'-nucleotidase
MKKTKKSAKIYLITAIAATVAFLGAMWSSGEIKLQKAEAATQKETIDLRIIGTTDIHGQLNSKDYELGVDYSDGGIARLYDIIQKTRNELPKENTVTLDAGDTLFDYTTEYIFSENQNFIQPIYLAMAKIGYDAITLGNHDFDYGYDYIKRQLDGSGLRDITVVSNVTDSKTGEFPFLENMMITRKMKTSAGNEVEVKIGIIGQTIPTLTSKTHSYTGILKTEDMVANATTQAAKLKEMGADIVVCLSHTGIGPETPELNFKNVAYALTKIPDVDVVVCGHEHNLFPTTDMTSPYFKLPNVDKQTFLMNGKNVIMAGNRGGAIGVVDLTLEMYKGIVRISERKSEIRLVTAENTKEEASIAKSYGEWEEKLLNYSTDIIASLKKGAVIQNYYGLLGDNAAIQLLNDSKIDYALRFVNTTGSKYKDYPIIAASTYAAYGSASIDDFINIHDSITESDLSAIQPYNNYVYVYTITGKQLKEWLEWTASAYETLSADAKWTNPTMSGLMKETGLKSLIREEWLNDWSSFYIFDGIDYIIDPFAGPRYDLSGNRISSNNRIQSLKYNGETITDDKVLLLATNKITQPTKANNGVEKQVALNGFVRTQAVLSKYIHEVSNEGSLVPQLDYNWRVSLPDNNSFLVKAPYYAHNLIEETSWYKKYISEVDKYRYYIASYPKENGDTTAPHIVATPVVTSATASPYNVAVHVSDASKLKEIHFLVGDYGVDYNGWVGGSVINNYETFKVNKNGVYSIYAEDVNGNKTVYKLVIDNFSDNMLGSPTYETYTNRKTKISGRGEANAKIVFEAYTGTYEGKVGSNGSFSYALPAQPSGTTVVMYLKDEKSGVESARISVPVKRTGPNQPHVNVVRNVDGYITGKYNDDDASLIVVNGDKVYVPENGGKALYEANTEVYNPSLEIIETKVEVDAADNFKIYLPPQDAGSTLTIYNFDHLSRNSRVVTLKVSDSGPNAPFVYEVSNVENTITGYIPTTSKSYDLVIALDGKTFNVKTDKAGKFTYEFDEQLITGDVITVTATDTKNGNTRQSYSTEVIVSDIEGYVKENSTTLTLNKVKETSYLVTGNYSGTGTIFLAITEGEGDNFKSNLYTLETDETGKFIYHIDGKLEGDTRIYALARFTDGKILLANKTVVIPTKPDMPSLLKKVTNTDKTVQVIAKKGSEVTLIIGENTYKSSQYEYDETNDRYIYTLTTNREVSGTEIQVTASNVSGTSEVFTSKIKKTAPDQPTVNAVKAGAKEITGKVELLDYIAPVEVDTKVTDQTLEDAATKITEQTEEIPKIFKDAPAKVAKTQTRIFAQIGKKTYEGTIDSKGKFKIKIPAQKVGVEIKIWGSNKAGRGPLIKVVVVK